VTGFCVKYAEFWIVVSENIVTVVKWKEIAVGYFKVQTIRNLIFELIFLGVKSVKRN
jgi:hypothetical protein